MKKAITLIVILAAVLMAGCSVVERFKVAEKQYLETRVAELMEEMPTEVVETVEPVATEEAKTVETEVVVEETVEPTVEITEEPVVEETQVVTEEPEVDLTVVSFDPAVYLGSPSWVDEMEKPEFWDVSASEYDLASFANGVMTMKALQDEPGWRIASTEELSKAYMEATVKMGACSGTDSYGLVFRVPKNVNYNQGYFFAITCDGRYSLRLWDGLTRKSVMLKSLTANSLINKVKDQTNRLGVAAVGDRLVLFINGEKVEEIVDETYPSGFFGLFVNRDVTKDLTVFVDQVRYWTNPEIK
jgi:hypothetical protein